MPDTISFKECCDAHWLEGLRKDCDDCSGAQNDRCIKEGDEWIKKRGKQ